MLLGTSGVLFSALALLVYLNTDSFQSLVRRRLVAEIERITGGRAEIASIHTIPFRLQAEVRGITVHGSESATEVPLAHVDHIVARLKMSSPSTKLSSTSPSSMWLSTQTAPLIFHREELAPLPAKLPWSNSLLFPSI